MGRIIVSENVSIDGVIQDPTGADDFEDSLGRGNWFGDIGPTDRTEWARLEFEEALSADALLLGRRSHEWFVARGWAAREDAWAERLRTVPKYVVSSSANFDGHEWQNSTVLRGDLLEEVSQLRQHIAGQIIVYGSGILLQTLIEDDLVDEFRLVVYPIVVGAGRRLFNATSDARPMRRVEARPIGEALMFLTYQCVREGGSAARAGLTG